MAAETQILFKLAGLIALRHCSSTDDTMRLDVVGAKTLVEDKFCSYWAKTELYLALTARKCWFYRQFCILPRN